MHFGQPCSPDKKASPANPSPQRHGHFYIHTPDQMGYTTRSMPIRERERKRLAARHMATYFPGATPEEITRVVDLCTNGFDGDYSPVRREQNHRSALGIGANYEEFVISVARRITREEPAGVTEERLGDILRKVSM